MTDSGALKMMPELQELMLEYLELMPELQDQMTEYLGLTPSTWTWCQKLQELTVLTVSAVHDIYSHAKKYNR
jgi:hypothetical protein